MNIDLIVAEMAASDIIARRNAMKFTVLHRPNGQWLRIEVNRIVNGLRTEVYEHPKHPEYVILYGAYDKATVLEAMWGGIAFTAEKVIGYYDSRLPFKPPM